MTQFTLAHLSDPHLAPPSGSFKLSDIASKRLFSRISWLRGRRLEHRPEVLDAVVADLLAQGPDHIAVTGDLTNYAAHKEIVAARRWLLGLGDPAAVTVTPGNHDVLVANPAQAGVSQWLQWLGDDLAAPAFPAVRIRGPVAVINLCSAIPTPLFSATGRLGEDQLARLGPILIDLGRGGLFRVILIHHPVNDGVVSARKRLLDAGQFREVIRQAGTELILHGHGHEPVSASIEGPAGPVPVLGAPSASAAAGHHHAPAHWRLIRIEDPASARRITVTERGIGPDGAPKVRELRTYPVPAAA